MRKLLILVLATLLGTAASAFAQGCVSFSNLGNTNWRLWTNNGTGSTSNYMTSAIANAYRIGLYVGTNAGSLELVGLAGNTSPFGPGYFLGGNPFQLPAPYAAGMPIVFQFRAWAYGGGASYEEALAAATGDPLNIALGVSALGTVTPAGVAAPPAPLFGPAPGLLTMGFEIGPIPEPSGIALGLLGLGTIFLFRRRK